MSPRGKSPGSASQTSNVSENRRPSSPSNAGSEAKKMKKEEVSKQQSLAKYSRFFSMTFVFSALLRRDFDVGKKIY